MLNIACLSGGDAYATGHYTHSVCPHTLHTHLCTHTHTHINTHTHTHKHTHTRSIMHTHAHTLFSYGIHKMSDCSITNDCFVANVCFTAIEFQKIVLATAIGFFIMGFIGYFVKLIHIPINNIIVYVIYHVVMVTVIISLTEDHEHWDDGLFSNFVYFNY